MTDELRRALEELAERGTPAGPDATIERAVEAARRPWHVVVPVLLVVALLVAAVAVLTAGGDEQDVVVADSDAAPEVSDLRHGVESCVEVTGEPGPDPRNDPVTVTFCGGASATVGTAVTFTISAVDPDAALTELTECEPNSIRFGDEDRHCGAIPSCAHDPAKPAPPAVEQEGTLDQSVEHVYDQPGEYLAEVNIRSGSQCGDQTYVSTVTATLPISVGRSAPTGEETAGSDCELDRQVETPPAEPTRVGEQREIVGIRLDPVPPSYEPAVSADAAWRAALGENYADTWDKADVLLGSASAETGFLREPRPVWLVVFYGVPATTGGGGVRASTSTTRSSPACGLTTVAIPVDAESGEPLFITQRGDEQR